MYIEFNLMARARLCLERFRIRERTVDETVRVRLYPRDIGGFKPLTPDLRVLHLCSDLETQVAPGSSFPSCHHHLE